LNPAIQRKYFFNWLVFVPIAAIIVVCACTSSRQSGRGTTLEPSVRVCIADYVQTIELSTEGAVVLTSLQKEIVLDQPTLFRCYLSSDGVLKLQIAGSTLQVDGMFRCYHKMPDNVFTFEGKKYSDTLVFSSDGSNIFLVNVLPIERYLRSVVPNEIGRNRKSEEIEAIKAQAILARTYTVMKINAPLLRLFDVYDDVRDQVYSGVTNHEPLVTKAILSCRGKVLMYENQLSECYFHSTCGGRTEAISYVWQRPQSKPYLIGLNDEDDGRDYCAIAPAYRWTEFYTRKEIEAILRNYLPSTNEAMATDSFFKANWYLLDIQIMKRSPSGRAAQLKIVLGDRKFQRNYYIIGDKIRWALRRSEGNALLRSTLFDIYIDRDKDNWIKTVRIDGGGNGHGVGLCQWGAIGRALRGHSHEKILHSYFPGTTISKIF
jgi:stage II sporulation protein D